MNDTASITGEHGILLILGSIAAALAALSVIWAKGVKPMIRLGKVIHSTYEKVTDYDERITKVEERSKQLVNNSGSSLRDAVDRIEASQNDQAKRLDNFASWGRDELVLVWKNLASRDVVAAAAKAGELVDRAADVVEHADQVAKHGD